GSNVVERRPEIIDVDWLARGVRCSEGVSDVDMYLDDRWHRLRTRARVSWRAEEQSGRGLRSPPVTNRSGRSSPPCGDRSPQSHGLSGSAARDARSRRAAGGARCAQAAATRVPEPSPDRESP